MSSAPLPPLRLPPPTQWAEFVERRGAEQLDRARTVAAEITRLGPADAMAVVRGWNELDTALANAGALGSLMAVVHPEQTVRSAAEALDRAATALSTELKLDRALFDVLAAVSPDDLEPQAAYLLELTLRDFRRAGVDRDQPTRARIQQLIERETQLAQDFSRAVRDDVRSISVDAAGLAGLPQDYVAAHPVDARGRVTVTTDYPDLVPFRTFAHDADARRELMSAFLNRAWPDNDRLLHELLAARHERATLLGYADWVDFDAEVKMAGTGSAIAAFIDQVSAAAEAAASRDQQVLLARLRQDDPFATGISAADTAYYTELVRREQFDVDAQQVRRYFDFGRVRTGLLDVTGALFAVRYEPVPAAEVWHPDVTVYDVLRDDSHPAGWSARAPSRLGRIYLDLHPRPGKYKHAAQFVLIPGVADTQLPEGALVCNFSTGLLEHDEVVTLFHEFGHLLHHVLGGGQPWERFSGVATEWDFVEAPSQLLEEWAWDPEVLRRFAVDEDGAAIPTDLVRRMRAADAFGTGFWARTQAFYSALSYQVHRGDPGDITALIERLQDGYSKSQYLDGTHFHASFDHLTGYTSGYYTYLWSLVIAKDLLSGFDATDLLAGEPAARYRDTILAQGGSRPAHELITAFLGRPYEFGPFQRWLDGPAAEPPPPE